jgi:FMN phosphatase YigB (HAD superfamily)
MARPRFIFFDVGNTLLFPNRPRILAPLPGDRHPSIEAWQALERRTKHEFDRGLLQGKVDHGFWWTFHTYLLQELNAFDDGVRWSRIRRSPQTGIRFSAARVRRCNAFERSIRLA